MGSPFVSEQVPLLLTRSFKMIAGVLLAFGLLVSLPQKISAAEPSQLVLHRGDVRHVFSVEVADTPELRSTGLMFRKDLAADAGMLFLYPDKKKISMWMKNTLISLDMMFLDRDGTILHMVEHTTPHSTAVISSRFRVKAVLEVAAGTADRLGLRIGDRAEHDLLPIDQ